jgi:hypothetical protein
LPSRVGDLPYSTGPVIPVDGGLTMQRLHRQALRGAWWRERQGNQRSAKSIR